MSYSSEIDLYLIIERIISWEFVYFWKKIGTSSWIFLIIRRSTLFIYYLKFLEWFCWALFLSLVTNGLIPISEASKLTFNSLETNLSLQIKFEWVLFFLFGTWMASDIVWSGIYDIFLIAG